MTPVEIAAAAIVAYVAVSANHAARQHAKGRSEDIRDAIAADASRALNDPRRLTR